MKRPAFQFYPESWVANAKLRRCSWEARGVWIAVLGLMHDSEEYGVLRYPLKEIVQALGCPMRALGELVGKGVMKGADKGIVPAYIYTPRHAGRDGAPVILLPEGDGPVWYSSRFVRDEYIRTKRGIGTRFGDEPIPPIGGTPTQRQGDGPLALDSVSIHGVARTTGDARGRGPKNQSGEISPFNGKPKPKPGWHRTEHGIVETGRALGIAANPGETTQAYKSRLFDAIRGH